MSADATGPMGPTGPTGPTRPKKKVGFALMDPTRIRELAHKGGVAVHAAGKGHKFSSEEARIAGAKGGHVGHAKRRTRAERDAAAPQEPKALVTSDGSDGT